MGSDFWVKEYGCGWFKYPKWSRGFIFVLKCRLFTMKALISKGKAEK